MEKISISTKKPKLPPVRIIDTVNKIRSGVSVLNRNIVPAPVAMLEMICGSWIAQSIGVVANLGVADHIGDKPASVESLAISVGAQSQALYRVMRALSTVGIFVEHEGRHFSLTSVGKTLRTDHPQSMRYMAIFQSTFNWEHWGELEHCVKTGGDAVQHVHGESGFEHLAKHPERAEIFDRAMTNISKMEMESILAAYDFSGAKVLADIGGGHGALLASVLGLNPSMQGILYDLPHAIEGAMPLLKSSGISDRIDFKKGSFFDEIPAGADTYMMKHIIHDWSDEESIKIMKNIRAKIPAHGKLLVIETVIPGKNVPHFSKFLDLEMLVVTTGRERTETEFHEIMKAAGFNLERVVPTISMANVLQAKPI